MSELNDEQLDVLSAPPESPIRVDESIPELESASTEVMVIPEVRTEMVVHEELPDQEYVEDVMDDFDLARKTMRDLLINGQKAVDNVLVLTKETEHPRTFEVAAGLIKTIGETAKDLLELHKSRRQILGDEEGGEEESSGGNVTNIQQAVFVGSTADLQAAFRDSKKQDEKVIDGSATSAT